MVARKLREAVSDIRPWRSGVGLGLRGLLERTTDMPASGTLIRDQTGLMQNWRDAEQFDHAGSAPDTHGLFNASGSL
jgi:hypothetical protein